MLIKVQFKKKQKNIYFEGNPFNFPNIIVNGKNIDVFKITVT